MSLRHEALKVRRDDLFVQERMMEEFEGEKAVAERETVCWALGV